MEQVRLDRILREAAGVISTVNKDSSVEEAEILLAEILHLSRTQLYLYPDRILQPEELQKLQEFLEKRCRHFPVQYLTGTQYFFGMEFKVGPGVLIPRPETELLVEKTIEYLRTKPGPVIVADIGTGSGNIAVSLAKMLSGTVFAVDISGEALEFARENAGKNSAPGKIIFIKGDFKTVLQEQNLEGKIDCLVANPPYIPAEDIPNLMPEVRDFEPRVAFDGGEKGLEVIKNIIDTAPFYLKPEAYLGIEIGLGQIEQVVSMLKISFKNIEITKDFAGIDRIITCLKK